MVYVYKLIILISSRGFCEEQKTNKMIRKVLSFYFMMLDGYFEAWG